MTDITHATPADLPALLDMIRALSAVHGDTARVTLHALETILFGPAAMATALIAKRNNQPVGYAGLTPSMVLHDGLVKIEIHHLYVSESVRSKGVGKALIRAAKIHARSVGATRLTIGTDANNASAIAAYRAMDMLEEITGDGPRFRVDLTT